MISSCVNGPNTNTITNQQVKRRFRLVLETSKDQGGKLRYMESIRQMCSQNLTSLVRTRAQCMPCLVRCSCLSHVWGEDEQ